MALVENALFSCTVLMNYWVAMQVDGGTGTTSQVISREITEEEVVATGAMMVSASGIMMTAGGEDEETTAGEAGAREFLFTENWANLLVGYD